MYHLSTYDFNMIYTIQYQNLFNKPDCSYNIRIADSSWFS